MQLMAFIICTYNVLFCTSPCVMLIRIKTRFIYIKADYEIPSSNNIYVIYTFTRMEREEKETGTHVKTNTHCSYHIFVIFAVSMSWRMLSIVAPLPFIIYIRKWKFDTLRCIFRPHYLIFAVSICWRIFD